MEEDILFGWNSGLNATYLEKICIKYHEDHGDLKTISDRELEKIKLDFNGFVAKLTNTVRIAILFIPEKVPKKDRN